MGHSHDHSHAGHAHEDKHAGHAHEDKPTGGHGGHSHGGHSHDHSNIRSFNKAFAIAVVLTLSYTFSEAIYGIFAHSMSLLADAAHNLGDGLGLILAWIANWLLSFPARKRYSYGFKRTTIIAALANAFILVASTAVIAYESINKLLHLHGVDEKTVIIVGVIGIFVNLGSSLLFMKGAQDDINIKGAFLHLMADALILLGVVVSAIIIHYTNLYWIDPVVGLVIVCIVLWGTWGLLRNSVSLIMDAVPQYIDYAGVRKYLSELPGVQAVHDLHIWGLSTREVALTVHLIVPERTLSDADYKEISNVLHEKFRIDHPTIQVERGDSEDACKQLENC